MSDTVRSAHLSLPLAKPKPPRDVIGILNAGGTFSAITRLNDDIRDTTLPTDRASTLKTFIGTNLDRHLYEYFGMSRQAGQRPENVVVEWIDIGHDDMIFSENATLSYWLRLTARLATYVNESRHRVVGLIVVHGTDTLAIATAAVQFLIKEQSMPVVFVASNRPLLDDRHQDFRLSSFESDAWSNLLLAMTFILICGRHYQRCALAFSNRIHYPINVRKVSNGSFLSSSISSRQRDQNLQGIFTKPEAFLFRNILTSSPYFCFELGGCLCRSSFADWPLSSLTQPDDNILNLAISTTEESQRQLDSILDRFHASANPASWHPHSPSTRIVLVDTFASGTIPTDERHPLVQSLKLCQDRNVAIAMSGPYGIDLSQCYDHQKLSDLGLRSLRFGPLIPETTAPLLAIAATIEDNLSPLDHTISCGHRLGERCSAMISQLGMIPPAMTDGIFDIIGGN